VFYHHLREHCDANDDQVKATKRAFGAIRSQAYDLLERLKYCSPLGPMLRGIRAGSRKSDAIKMPGIATIRRLEAAGITNLVELSRLSVDALVTVGLQKRYAKQIRAYIERRMR
jgi:helicase